jgi:hypothetical protein
MSENTVYSLSGEGKVCIICQKLKSASEFYARRNSPDGLRSDCKDCVKIRSSKQREYVLDEIKASKSNTDPLHQRLSARFRISAILSTHKRDCALRNIECSLELTYLMVLLEAQNNRCVLTGLEMTVGESVGRMPDACGLSLDRINTKKGYIPGNVRFVTYQANLAKNRFHDQDFINLCFSVVAHFNKNSDNFGIPPNVRVAKSSVIPFAI